MFLADKLLILLCCVFVKFQISNGYEADGTIVRTVNFNARADAEALHKALAGIGTRDSAVIAILCKRTNQERQEIAKFYETMFRRDLHKHIASDTSGNYGHLMKGLMEPTTKYDCELIRKAIKGLGTNFDLLIEVLLTRTPAKLQAITREYHQHTKKQLIDDITGDVNRDVQTLLVTLSRGSRDQGNTVNPILAKKDAQDLYKAGKNKLGTDNHVFIEILTKRNYAHLLKVFEDYEILAQVSLERSIASEMSGKLQTALLVLVKCIRNPSVYFAEKIRTALKKGLLGGTDEKALDRIFITRSEVDMVQIIKSYRNQYRQELESDLRGDVHGNYQSALVALLKGNRQLKKKRSLSCTQGGHTDCDDDDDLGIDIDTDRDEIDDHDE